MKQFFGTKKTSIARLFIAAAIFAFFAFSAYAEVSYPGGPLGSGGESGGTSIQNPIQSQEFKDVISSIADWATAISVPLTTLLVLYAGYLYLTGGGSPEQIKKAHQALTWAAVGFIVILVANGAAALIKSILGVK